MSIGQNSLPMTRYALILGSHSCQTLSAAAVCPSLDTCTAPTPHKTITNGLARGRRGAGVQRVHLRQAPEEEDNGGNLQHGDSLPT